MEVIPKVSNTKRGHLLSSPHYLQYI